MTRLRAPLIVCLLAFVGAALAVHAWKVAQGVDPGPEAAVTLTLFRYFGGCSDRYADVTNLEEAVGECGVIQVLTNRFNAEHAGAIVVRTQTAEWSGYYDRLSAAYAARRPPDLAVMNRSVLPSFVRRGLVLPLGQALRQAGVDLHDLVPSATAAGTVDGDLYGLPYDLHGLLWHLNLGLLAEAGLVDASGAVLPSSPEALFAHAEAVRRHTGKPYFAIPSQTDPMPLWMFETWVWQQGADLMADTGGAWFIDSPESRRALALLAAVYSQGYADAAHDYAAAEQAFLNGEAAVLVH